MAPVGTSPPIEDAEEAAPQAAASEVPVPASAEVAPPPAPAEQTGTAEDLLAGRLSEPDFHDLEDRDPDQQLIVACGGMCPTPYVCESETTAKRSMVAGRIAFCEHAGRRFAPDMQGAVTVRARIDRSGKVDRVNVTVTGSLTRAVKSCVARLVGSIRFGAKDKRTRRIDERYDLDVPPEGCR